MEKAPTLEDIEEFDMLTLLGSHKDAYVMREVAKKKAKEVERIQLSLLANT